MSVVAMRRCWPVEAWSTCQSRGPCICDLWWSARCGGRPWNSCEGEHPFSASPHSSSFPYRRSTVRYPCPRPACTVSASFPWMAKSVLSWCAGTHIGIPKSLLIYPYSFMSRLTFIWGSAVDLFYSAPRVFSVDFVGRRFSELARGRSGSVIILFKMVERCSTLALYSSLICLVFIL